MRILRIVLACACLAPAAFADLTQTQKVSDFMQLVGFYAVNYGPYELKRDVFGFDLFNVQPWLDQVQQSKSDVEFYDVLTRYVASLQDSHDEFTINSDYDAWLHFDGDIYDGKFLIADIDRSYLPSRTYPFTIGDELISVDGVAVNDLLTKFAPYAVNGSSNPQSRQRLAAAAITERYQGWNPLAAVGAKATIVVNSNGTNSNYSIPWDVIGTLVTSAGTIPSPTGNARTAARAAQGIRRKRFQTELRKGVDAGESVMPANPWLRTTPDPTFQPSTAELEPDPIQPSYMAPLEALSHAQATSSDSINGLGLEPFDNLFPVFNPPANFKMRLGGGRTDLFMSGTFQAGSSTIGFIRIPTFAPTSTTTAIQQFSTEIQYFQQNTDALVVDVMGNGGGSLCYGQTLASYLIPNTFQGVGVQVRATLFWQASISQALSSAQFNGAPAWVANLYNLYLQDIKQALAQNRGRTGALPICSYTFNVAPPTSSGKVLSYTKPILVLTDNFTLSTAESFSMQLQDNQRATIFGTRTDGGGGDVVGYNDVTAYSEGNARVTIGVIQRLNSVAANGYPSMPYYDGVGIQPDMVQDYQTKDNLMNSGKTFVTAFTAAVQGLIANANH